MHRHSAARTPGGDDGHRRVQPEPRSEATSGQQQVLNLQQGVGNSITGQIVQRSPSVIRRAGDKLSFQRGTELGEDEGLAEKVSAVIEKQRQDKRGTKDRLEKRKEDSIELGDLLSKAEGTIIRSRGNRLKVPPEVTKLRQERNEASTVAEHKKTLAKFHDDVQAKSGWRWERMKDELSAIKGIKFGDEPRDGKVEITGSESGRKIYTIYFGVERFNKDADVDREDGADNVFTKRGYGPTVKPKQFVKDNNGVHTRRFVTRAITIWHVAAMFGLNLKPKKGGGADVEPAYVDEAKTTRLDAQLPRYTGDIFGDHSDTFDVGKAAAYVPSGEGRDTEFRRYRHDRVTGGKGKRTQYEFTKGTSQIRGRYSAMELNERASMQVRNGSGPNQPFLSTASAQIDPKRPKVIRANKGERFDTGAENQGIVKVDLAKAKKLGIKIVNQHDDESNKHKIAWDRFYDPGDIKKLSERYQLALKYPDYAKEIRPQWDEVSMFTQEERRALRDGKPQEVNSKKYVKRSAPEELDEYIYSARKNREVLMDKIPIGCVTEINLNKDEGKWPGLDESIKRGEWLDFTSELQGKLKAYLRGTGSDDVKDEKYDNIQAMYERAEIDKAKEGGNRT